MKSFKHKFTLLVIFFTLTANSQSFNNPESITFDKKTNSFFVSNAKIGEIQKMNKYGIIYKFISGYSSFLGVKIYKGIIYSAENIKNGDDFVLGFSKKKQENRCSHY